MKKILIIDGNSILNRAFYGVAPLTASDGTPTGAVFGFIKILKRHHDALSPDFAVCAFDLPDPTFRHIMYKEYKANRSGMPEDLAVQLPIAKEAASAMGYSVVTCAGYEADDIIGTLAAEAGCRDVEAYILTGDRDSLQLIGGNTRVILAKTKGDVIFDRALFREEYGIDPEQFVDVKALMGDSSDNIPGVKGIGEKTALKFISAAGSLDNLYDDPTAYGAKGANLEKLTSGKEMAYISRDLARIDTNVPGLDRDAVFTEHTIDKAVLSSLFTKLEFDKLRDSFGLDGADDTATLEKCDFEDAVHKDVTPDELVSLVTDKAVSVAFNREDDVLKLSVYHADAVYTTSIGTNDSAILKQFFDDHSVVCFDFKNICKILLPMGIAPVCDFDVMLAAYLLSPGEGSYPLERILQKYIPGADISDAYAVSLLKDALLPMLRDYDMEALLYDIEQPLSSVLAKMELAGFTVDGEGLHNYITSLSETVDNLTEQIYMKAGRRINLNSPKQLGELLFEDLGLPAGRKTKTGYSTDAETLERLRPYSDIASDILDYRQLSKLCGTYGDSLISLAAEDGKIHTVLHQTGTATGRLSSSDPNMQNIPVRDQLGRELRRYFTASSPDRLLIDGDYSQIELRLLAELSKDTRMMQAFIDGEDIHRRTASQVFGVPFEMVTPELRSRAKAVNFGIVYGIGAFSLSKDLRISRKMADEYIKNYLSTYSGVDAFLKGSIEHAHTHGYTVTMFGRRRYIPEISSRNKNLQAFGERVAMNSPVQGSAADIIKLAMINVSAALESEGLDAKLILQVHDELIIDSSVECADRAAEILKNEMENAAKTVVPLSVDVSVGYSWYDAK